MDGVQAHAGGEKLMHWTQPRQLSMELEHPTMKGYGLHKIAGIHPALEQNIQDSVLQFYSDMGHTNES